MQKQLEIEYKILLTPTIYNQILEDYQESLLKQYKQTNYYLLHPTLDVYHYMLRIREKNNHYELTLKEPITEDSNLETTISLTEKEAHSILCHQYSDNPIFKKILSLDIPLHEIDTEHTLQTFRIDIKQPFGILSMDKNMYEGIIDYELEFEVTHQEQGKKAFLQLLETYQLSYQKNCLSKIQRLKKQL